MVFVPAARRVGNHSVHDFTLTAHQA